MQRSSSNTRVADEFYKNKQSFYSSPSPIDNADNVDALNNANVPLYTHSSLSSKKDKSRFKFSFSALHLIPLMLLLSLIFLWFSTNPGDTSVLVKQVAELYDKISCLESLNPSKEANMLFSKLVLLCTPPSPIDVTKLSNEIQEMRSKLIILCGLAEGLLEKHYSTLLGSYQKPLDHLEVFPYYSNYIKLGFLEYNILAQHSNHEPKRIAFMGSGPLPMTSIVLALYHLPNTQFDNYDMDSSANEMAARLVKPDPDLSTRMQFYTKNVMSMDENELGEYDVVFLAALVGMDKKDKIKIIQHLSENMKPGSTLMLRSAHGARAFLYPIVNEKDLCGFQVLSIYHPTDDVINSVVIAKKNIDDSDTPIYSTENNYNLSSIFVKSATHVHVQAST